MIEYVAFYATIYAIILLLYLRNKKSIKFYYKIALLYFSKFGINFIKRVGNIKALKYLKYFLVIIGVAGVFISLYLLTFQVFKGILIKKPLEVSLPIPGSKVGQFRIPLIEGALALVIVTLIHEFSHGIIASHFKGKVKSTGFGMFLFLIPTAFVEIDEKKFRKMEETKRIAIASAGPISNLITALIAILILSHLIVPFFNSQVNFEGVKIEEVVKDSPASRSGLKEGVIINEVNGTSFSNLTAFINLLSKFKPNSNVSLSGPNGTFYVITGFKNNKTYYGIVFTPSYTIKSFLFYVASFFYNLFFWIYLFSIALALTNFLPFPISDGGQILYNLFIKIMKDKTKAAKVTSIFFYYTLFILLTGIIVPRV